MFRRSTVSRVLLAHERERAAWAQERSVLLDRIMFLAGRPWQLPDMPSPEREPELVDDDLVADAHQVLA
jgi:CHASE1-domain containing sensor protein